MLDLTLFERTLKKRKIVRRRASEALRELEAVVGLHAFDRESHSLEVLEHDEQFPNAYSEMVVTVFPPQEEGITISELELE